MWRSSGFFCTVGVASRRCLTAIKVQTIFCKRTYQARPHLLLICRTLYNLGSHKRNIAPEDGNKNIKIKTQRPPGGGRPLTDPRKVYDYNNWDNVVWDEQQESEAKKQVEKNTKTPVAPEDQEKFEREAGHFWDEFYTQHQNRFFKDRHWLFTEFPELAPAGVELPEHIPVKAGQGEEPEKDGQKADKRMNSPKNSMKEECMATGANGTPKKNCTEGNDVYPGHHTSTRILEVGCGVGNTVFPVLQTNVDHGLFVYCCDLSSTAIQLVKDHPDYSTQRCHAFVCDVTDPSADMPFPMESLDLVVLIFVLSAIHPDRMQDTVSRLATYLKPGGLIVFRDYGRYDLAQLRFKDGKCLQENFYVRGDGTRVYFFTQEELGNLFMKAGLLEEQNLIDRRLQVNRGRQLKMYRVWIQCKYRKPVRL